MLCQNFKTANVLMVLCIACAFSLLSTERFPFAAPCANAQNIDERNPHRLEDLGTYSGQEQASKKQKECPKQKMPVLKLSKLPKIGDVLRDLTVTHVFQLTSASNGDPAYGVKLDGIDYEIAVELDSPYQFKLVGKVMVTDYSEKKNGTVVYIATSSAKFKTPEGFSTENTLGDLQAKYPKDIRFEPGWGTYVILPSGWAGGVFDMNHPGVKGDPKTKIMWFFQRRGNMPPKTEKKEDAAPPTAGTSTTDAAGKTTDPKPKQKATFRLLSK